MHISTYPSTNYLKDMFSKICSQHTGICESQIVTTAKAVNAPKISLFVNQMPAYHKLVLSEKADIHYHLSGYGFYNEEGLIRLVGEGIERYALLISAGLYKNKIIYASYKELESQGDIMPWEYIDIIDDADYEKLKSISRLEKITKEDVIGWLKCPSIFNPDREIYIPAQLLFMGYKQKEGIKEKIFNLGFSKGAASHTSMKKALCAAILESIEADATMIRWYTKLPSKRIIIDDTALLKIIGELLSGFSYDLIPYLYNLPEMPANSFGIAMVNNKAEYPASLMGCQSSMNPVKGLYRGLMEALGIFYMANYGPLYFPEDYFTVSKEDESFANLDSNVSYFSKVNDMDQKRQLFNSLYEGEVSLSGLKDYSHDDVDQELLYLLKSLKKVSEYGVYLDITPPEVADKGWKVMRTYFPELVQMSLPSFPFKKHPRIQKYGGVKNEFPHPLP